MAIQWWVALCLLHGSVARAEPVEAPFRAAILMRSLGYERGIAAGAGALSIVVLSGEDPASQTDARAVAEAFEALARRMKVGARSVTIRRVEHRSVSDTRALLRELSPSMVYFARGLEGVSFELMNGARHLVAACADGAALGAGCALGVRSQGGASQLVIALTRTQRAGLSFDPRMLRLSHVLP